MDQQVRFCAAPDGVRIAYATVGNGPPLVKAANWLNHLEFDWKSPVWRPWFEELTRDHTLVRYDERGNGLSDWNVEDLSMEAFVSDLESVVDAAGLRRFPLLGISQGGAVAIAYAVRHPEKVSHLVLYGAYARGWAKRDSENRAEQERRQAMVTLIRQGWGQDNPAFRQMWTSLYMPDASREQMSWFNEMQRVTTSPENAAKLVRVLGDIDVVDLLGQVRTPTLVLHCREDAAVPFEAGRGIAARISGARFVELPGKNHILLNSDAGWPQFLEEVRSFLAVAPRSVISSAVSAFSSSGMSPSRAPLAPGGRLNHYRLSSALGAGGMGVVYRARDEKLGRDVALKVLPAGQATDAAARARMLREAQTASALNHPHICHIYEIGAADGCDYIAMELVEGRALSASIPHGGLPIDIAIRYGEQMADALEHAHSRNVLHRDIKSSNVVVTPEGRVKILDFGLAKRMSEEFAGEATLSQVSPLTQAGTIAGTLNYLAPEVLSGHPADARSDLWALGVVLYEMSSGALPFQGRTSFEVSSAILRESVKPQPARVPPGLRGVIQRCLAKEPAQRYQRASEIRAALEAIGSGASQPVPVAAPSFSQPQESKPLRGIWIGASVVVLSLLGFLAWDNFFSDHSRPSAEKSSLPSTPPPPGASAPTGAGPKLTGGGKPSPVAEANEYFEKAMLFLRGRFEPQRARTLLERALEFDPKFAEARAVYALTHILYLESGVSNESAWIYKAEQDARQALKDDPECATAHAILVAAYYYQGKTEEGLREAEACRRFMPDGISCNVWKAKIEHLRGNYSSALEIVRRMLQREPTLFPAQGMLGAILHETGDRAEAVRVLGKFLDQDTNNDLILCEIAHMHIETGDVKAARMFLDRVTKTDRRNYRVRMTHALLLAAEGKRRDAQREMDAEVIKFAENSPGVTLQMAEYYALMDDLPQAMAWLERAVRNGDERVEWFKTNPLLAKLREIPRFQQILDSITFRRAQK